MDSLDFEFATAWVEDDTGLDIEIRGFIDGQGFQTNDRYRWYSETDRKYQTARAECPIYPTHRSSQHRVCRCSSKGKTMAIFISSLEYDLQMYSVYKADILDRHRAQCHATQKYKRERQDIAKSNAEKMINAYARIEAMPNTTKIVQVCEGAKRQNSDLNRCLGGQSRSAF